MSILPFPNNLEKEIVRSGNGVAPYQMQGAGLFLNAMKVVRARLTYCCSAEVAAQNLAWARQIKTDSQNHMAPANWLVIREEMCNYDHAWQLMIHVLAKKEANMIVAMIEDELIANPAAL